MDEYTVGNNFQLKKLYLNGKECKEDPFASLINKIVDEFDCDSRTLLKKLTSRGKCKIPSWYLTTSDQRKITSLHIVYAASPTISSNDYMYYFLEESEVSELYCRIKALIDQYSRRGPDVEKKADTEKQQWCTRYMADSSGCDGNGFSHGFEALLDYQLSWNCRIACYGHDNKKLVEQCKHIFKVLINPEDKNEDYSIIDNIKNVCVYKQWEKTDLIIELYFKKEQTIKGEKYDRCVILVEDKAFTTIKNNQIIEYPERIKKYYDIEWREFKHCFLLRVVTLQTDGKEIIRETITQYLENIKSKWEWEVLSDDDLLIKKDGLYMKTRNPLFDEFWITDRDPVDPAKIL